MFYGEEMMQKAAKMQEEIDRYKQGYSILTAELQEQCKTCEIPPLKTLGEKLGTKTALPSFDQSLGSMDLEKIHNDLIAEQNRVMHENLKMFLGAIKDLIADCTEQQYPPQETLDLVEGMINTELGIIDLRQRQRQSH